TELDPEERETQLDALDAVVAEYGSQVNTGNGVLDVVFTMQSQQCLAENITLTTVVDGAALNFMSAVDLAALFGNALDNAREAVAAVLDESRRIIKVSVARRDQLVVIAVENYLPQPLLFLDGEILTRKADKERHGFGLKSIAATAEKYGGTITIKE